MHAWAIMEGASDGSGYRLVELYAERKDAEMFCRLKWPERTPGPPTRYRSASYWPGVWVRRAIIHEALQNFFDEMPEDLNSQGELYAAER